MPVRAHLVERTGAIEEVKDRLNERHVAKEHVDVLVPQLPYRPTEIMFDASTAALSDPE